MRRRHTVEDNHLRCAPSRAVRAVMCGDWSSPKSGGGSRSNRNRRKRCSTYTFYSTVTVLFLLHRIASWYLVYNYIKSRRSSLPMGGVSECTASSLGGGLDPPLRCSIIPGGGSVHSDAPPPPPPGVVGARRPERGGRRRPAPLQHCSLVTARPDAPAALQQRPRHDVLGVDVTVTVKRRFPQSTFALLAGTP